MNRYALRILSQKSIFLLFEQGKFDYSYQILFWINLNAIVNYYFDNIYFFKLFCKKSKCCQEDSKILDQYVYSAFISNIGMMLYVSCWMAQYCYQAKSYKIADLTGMDHYQTWVIMNIAGASCLLLGLLISLAKIAIDQAALGYGSLGVSLIGWILITIGMGIGSDTTEFKNTSLDYNIPVSNWFAMTGICFQISFNGYEHSIQEDDSTGQTSKQVEI
ncbi:unnamed protein product (macronuclear) [Paramecium tetraurelia]|uniref:Uncharacterized protein n=1 Tax=Paramecium tetraurelia TaxID=5888 RepID=A0E3U5_PARTE|nr:uncharacterized protein GSPATT00023135001 [Paramecium tetraurelia]CAK89962.1 unnamed protein product [Paramecium tetraurelia]|eukprot:XP_001457359.1 hypothetical protein (macronuclear) [Paramecium tetraurelia strain d4-2]